MPVDRHPGSRSDDRQSNFGDGADDGQAVVQNGSSSTGSVPLHELRKGRRESREVVCIWDHIRRRAVGEGRVALRRVQWLDVSIAEGRIGTALKVD